MKLLVLGIDTSCSTAQVSLTDNGFVLGEIAINDKKTHSVKLMPAIETLLNNTGKKVSELELIGVINGPGSFTGLRIGVTTAKGIAYSVNAPVVGVSSLEMLSRSACFNNEQLVCPVLDARNDQVYCAVYKNNEIIVDERACSVNELCEDLEKLAKDAKYPIVFCGDGVEKWRELFKKTLNDKYTEVNSEFMLGRAGSTSVLAEKKFNDKPSQCTVDNLNVNYLRKPQAERMKKNDQSK